MTECFITKFCCLHCLITKEMLVTLIDLSDIQRRNPENFYEGLENSDMCDRDFLTQSQGVRRVSEIVKLKYINMPSSFGADVFHDIDEGFGKDFLNEWQKIVLVGGMTREIVTSRMINFDYGPLDQAHKPSDLKHLSGLQVRNLIFRLNFMFADLKDQLPSEIFQASGLLSKIVQIIYSENLNESHLTQLDQFIRKVLTIWTEIFGQRLKPKSHFMLHYAEIIRKVGPLSLLETTSFERKHRIFTRVAEKNSQFINIVKSCADRHQSWWASEWSNDFFYNLSFKGPKYVHLSMQNVTTYPDTVDWNSPVCTVKSATYVFEYKPNLFLANFEEGVPHFKFLEIKVVIVNDEKIYLKCAPLDAIFDEFFSAFKILTVDSTFVIVALDELKHKEPLAGIKPYGSDEQFILSKRNLV